MTKVNNVFFLNDPVQKTIDKILLNKKRKYQVSCAGESVLVMLSTDNDRITLLFKPEQHTFTYDVNGHFFGTFFFTKDKVVVKWPNRIREQEKMKIMQEVQNVFHTYL